MTDASQVNAETLSALKGLESLFGRYIVFNRDHWPVVADALTEARIAIRNAEALDPSPTTSVSQEDSNG